MKKIITRIAMLVLIMSAMTVVANAADFDKNPAPVDVAKKLVEDGTVTIAYGESDQSGAATLKLAVQEYVDAITTESQTPTIKCSIRNPRTANSEIVMNLVYGESINFETSRASDSFESINSYICDMLSYDKEAAANAANLNITHSSWTANGAVSTGKAVCQGYSNLFAILAEKLGYEVIKMRGHTDTGYHVLNVIRVDGKYIAIDVTMNDTNNYRNNITHTLDEYCSSQNFVPSIDVEAAFAAKYAA